jgi:hypothetical protein
VKVGDTIALVADLHFFREVDDALLGIAVFDESRNQIYGDSVPWGAPYHFVNGQRARISVTLEPRLASGTYSAHIGIGTADGRVLTRVNPTVTFYVNGGPRTRGIADLRAEFNVTSRGPTV